MRAFALYKGCKLVKLQELIIETEGKINKKGTATSKEMGYLEDLRIAVRWKIEELCEKVDKT